MPSYRERANSNRSNQLIDKIKKEEKENTRRDEERRACCTTEKYFDFSLSFVSSSIQKLYNSKFIAPGSATSIHDAGAGVLQHAGLL